MTLTKVRSLADLSYKARRIPAYADLAIIAARNLGDYATTLDEAMKWLNVNAMETSEDDVVEEVNYCIDLMVDWREGRRTTLGLEPLDTTP